MRCVLVKINQRPARPTLSPVPARPVPDRAGLAWAGISFLVDYLGISIEISRAGKTSQQASKPPDRRQKAKIFISLNLIFSLADFQMVGQAQTDRSATGDKPIQKGVSNYNADIIVTAGRRFMF